MMVKEARALLTAPKFGNPQHIEAVCLLELFFEAVSLNGNSADFTMECDSCDGSGECKCECRECGSHECGTCDGSGEVYGDDAETFSAETLQDIIEDLEVFA